MDNQKCKVKTELERFLNEKMDRRSEGIQRLFHYTSVENLCGILASQSVYLNRTHNLSDTLEIDYGFKLFIEKYYEDRHEIGVEELKKLIEKYSLDALVDGERELMKEYILMERYKNEAVLHFTSSFSRSKNDIKLWNLYADRFNGVVIEFNRQSFIGEPIDDEQMTAFMFHKVIYKESEAKNLFAELISTHENISCKDCGSSQYHKFYLFICASVIFPSIKHKNFHFEKEMRIINITLRPPDVPHFEVDINRSVPEKGMLKYDFEYSDINKIYLCKNWSNANEKKTDLISTLKKDTHFDEFEKLRLLQLNDEAFKSLTRKIVYVTGEPYSES